MIAGYLEWEREFGERRPQLAGVELQGFPRSVRWARQADAELLRMDDGSTVAQSSLVGPDAPAGRSPYRVSFDLLFGSVHDFDLVQEAAGRGEPVLFFPGWWHVDQWLVPVGGTGRTTWRTSRRLAGHGRGDGSYGSEAVAGGDLIKTALRAGIDMGVGEVQQSHGAQGSGGGFRTRSRGAGIRP